MDFTQHVIILNLVGFWLSVAGSLHLVISIPTALHILLQKNNERTAIGWIGLVLLSPFLGSAFYWIFGINRIKRRAMRDIHLSYANTSSTEIKKISETDMPPRWQALMATGNAIYSTPYVGNNAITALINGDEAYPEMLSAISLARENIILSSYIFDYDQAGKRFVEALGAAVKRGVAVRVMIDGVGIGYRWRKTDAQLKKRGVKTIRFLPRISVAGLRFINLRNHRKILCIDGKVAFVGGMNIRFANLVQEHPKHPVADVHFKVSGPVIDQIASVFIEDWYFAAKEKFEFPIWQAASDLNLQSNSQLSSQANIVSRVIQDGPDQNVDRLRWTLIAALNCAEQSIKIVTPYFVPDQILVSVLQLAALRGVMVEIIIPKRSNYIALDWATCASFHRYLEYKIHIYQSPAPFDHSKIVIVDDTWSFIGSSNWDARSLDLNFEINLECYAQELNNKLSDIFDNKKLVSTLVCDKHIAKVPLFSRMRNNLFRLFSPYL